MRFDKFTTKFQQAFADAQSLAIGNDNPYIEPLHLLLALIEQEDGGTSSLLAKAGVNVGPLREALRAAIDRLPKVEGHGGEVNVSRELSNLLNLTDKEAQKRGDQFIASELFLLALLEDKGEAGRLVQAAWGDPRASGAGDRVDPRRPERRRARRRRASVKPWRNTPSISPSVPARASSTR